MSTTDGDGDCYLVAAQIATAGNAHPTAVLCHGTCTGHGPIEGIAFGHAWVEFEPIPGLVLVIEQSNGHDATLPRDTYYAAGECRDVTRYTPHEARQMMTTHGHYGPWPTTTPKDEHGTDH